MSDTELPSVSSGEIRKARKEHKCCECQRIIKAGDRYQLVKGCWEGKWSRFKTCMACEELREDLACFASYDHEAPAFGYLAEWAAEAGIKFPVEEI